MTIRSILSELKRQARPGNVAGMARFGINSDHALGVSMPVLRVLAKRIGRDHVRALALWKSGVHEARMLAALTDEPARVTEAQLEKWVGDLDSWDVCDQLCSNLIDKTPFAEKKAYAWSARKEPFVKRAGLVVMAALSVHNKTMTDAAFKRFLPVIERESRDERNFVKKAVNWALRQIGKRNTVLHQACLRRAERIARIDSPAARWIAADALRELKNPQIIRRIRSKRLSA